MSPPAILCLDDQLEKITAKAASLPLFTAITHHANLVTFFITQTLFMNDVLKQILRQSTYLVIFDNVRARRQLNNLSSQMFGSSKFLSLCMKDNLENGGCNFLLLDLRTREPVGGDLSYNDFDCIRVRSGIFGVHDCIYAYHNGGSD